MPVVLETVDLEKHFGGIAAVAGVSLKIEKGARHALIGPNGAGKTTVINLLTGVLRPSAGTSCSKGRTSPRSRPTGGCSAGSRAPFRSTSCFSTLRRSRPSGLPSPNGRARARTGGV